jgi:hemoglobin
MKADILTRADVEKLIIQFYANVRQDTLLAPVFQHVDWPHHTPIIIDFWSSLLLGDQSYKRNPFQKHIDLPITSLHFSRWLELFHQTIHENFVGEKAAEARDRSINIATLFKHRLGLE